MIFKGGRENLSQPVFLFIARAIGTGREEYDEIGDCVITPRVQADHESARVR